MLHALIMAGGGGTRFWPRSRQSRPKQLLRLGGDRSLIQMTWERLEPCIPPERTWVLTAARLRDEVQAHLPAIPPHQIVGEPVARDTAPCVALGAASVADRDPEAVMAVVPADHIIEPPQEFGRVLHAAAELVQDEPQAIVTIGISPTWPSTGYGYIQRGQELTPRQNLRVFQVRKFHEKPDRATAEVFLRSGEFYWNGGVFIARARTFLDQFRRHEPEIAQLADAIVARRRTDPSDRGFADLFERMKKVSFDYAVMEKCPRILTIEARFRWDDVGSWLALERLHPQDATGNTILAEHVGVDTSRCIIVGEGKQIIATIGVSNLIIVQDGECILVADRSREGDVKKVVELMRQRGWEKHL
jgi:mannose-1-phosphate guanylyltransferase